MSATIAFRVAKVLDMSLHHVLTGTAPTRGTCKHRGRSNEEASAMTVTRVAIGDMRLVYVIVATTKLEYPKGRSRTAYIGTTEHGVARVAQSAASRN